MSKYSEDQYIGCGKFLSIRALFEILLAFSVFTRSKSPTHSAISTQIGGDIHNTISSMGIDAMMLSIGPYNGERQHYADAPALEAWGQ